MRSGCDVNQIVFGIGIEWILSCKAGKLFVHLLEVPWIVELDFMKLNLRLRRNRLDVACDDCRQGSFALRVQQLEPSHDEVGLPADRNRGSPGLPTISM